MHYVVDLKWVAKFLDLKWVARFIRSAETLLGMLGLDFST